MKTFSDCPFPVAWTADALADAVPRRLSTLFASGIATPDASLTRNAASARLRRHPLDRGLPTLFRVR